MSVARQVLILQLVVLAVVVAAGTVLAVLDARRDSDDATRQEVVGVAVSLAAAPSTAAALRAPDPTSLLQPRTERIRLETGLDFIVVMAPDRTRFTHANTDQIGKQFSGNIDRALAGETFTETYTGTLGPSIRSVTPVYDDDGTIIGLVSAGVTRAQIGEQVAHGLPAILGVALIGLALAAIGSVLLSRRLRRQTLGMAPAELRTMYEHHDAVLHSIREGLVVFGSSDNADVVNDEARRLLDLPSSGVVTLADLPESMRPSSESTRSELTLRDEMHVTPSRVLVVNRHPVEWEGRRIGTVLTIRDHTELQSVMGELDSVRGFAESLRSQAHESANRLHTVITMVELGRYDEAVQFATAELQLSQHLIDRLLASVHEPAIAALLLGKVGQAAERGVELTVSEDTAADSLAPLTTHEAVTLIGNLVDNAVDVALQTDDAWVEVTVQQDTSRLVVRVADSGPGMSAVEFERATGRGYSTKDSHHGLGLALISQLVARHGGEIATERQPCAAIVVTIPSERR
ncbi:sensor histidine kinase [Antrihabitans sp. YC2-6]|uniref:sensor histidine kinase n=1 Tax=Antrihabitans sp. YC2-6 TaxID=2799498 RepID=UPI0018F52B92|nr:sensor histidine kinase [Antrihabitans sp. YC2-6]MBJ8344569.1 sensor histidine kinase [Antrihabitans sp. YC2-6]